MASAGRQRDRKIVGGWWRTMRRRLRRSWKAGIMVVTCPQASLPSFAKKSKKRDGRHNSGTETTLVRWREMKIMWCFCIIRYTDWRHGGASIRLGRPAGCNEESPSVARGSTYFREKSLVLSLLPFALWFGPTCLWNGSCRAQGERLAWWATSLSLPSLPLSLLCFYLSFLQVVRSLSSSSFFVFCFPLFLFFFVSIYFSFNVLSRLQFCQQELIADVITDAQWLISWIYSWFDLEGRILEKKCLWKVVCIIVRNRRQILHFLEHIVFANFWSVSLYHFTIFNFSSQFRFVPLSNFKSQMPACVKNHAHRTRKRYIERYVVRRYLL